MTYFPLSWGGTRIPPPVSGTFLVCGNVPLGTLLRGKEEEGNAFKSLLRDALSAMAAETREAWSVPLINEIVGELRRSEASGSFSKEGGGSDGCALLSGCLFNDPKLLHIQKFKNIRKSKKPPISNHYVHKLLITYQVKLRFLALSFTHMLKPITEI